VGAGVHPGVRRNHRPCRGRRVWDARPSARSDDTESSMRYMPPNGTVGVTRSAVRGIGRLPSPPAGTIARTLADMT
jgi:hypothetical protein